MSTTHHKTRILVMILPLWCVSPFHCANIMGGVRRESVPLWDLYLSSLSNGVVGDTVSQMTLLHLCLRFLLLKRKAEQWMILCAELDLSARCWSSFYGILHNWLYTILWLDLFEPVLTCRRLKASCLTCDFRWQWTLLVSNIRNRKLMGWGWSSLCHDLFVLTGILLAMAY